MKAKELKERRERVLNRTKAEPLYTPQEYALYKEICASRSTNRIEDFPQPERDVLTAFIAYITSKYQIKEISLRGSYMKGEWVNNDTSEEFKRLRSLIKHKTKNSDIDLVIEGMREQYEIDGILFDIIPHDPQCVHIWANF